MDEQQINENKTLSGDDIACPNCGSHNVRCVPYPKVEYNGPRNPDHEFYI
jgi:hypothetical protein